MRTRDEARRRAYERVRHDFEDLRIEDRAVFLVEAAASTLARGVEKASRALADEVEQMFQRGARPRREGAPEPGAPGAAEPETGRQRTSRSAAPEPPPDAPSEDDR